MAKSEKPKGYKRRFGDRSDGRRIRTNPPMARVSPYIMGHRNGATNQLEDTIDVGAIDSYLREKRNAGMKNISFMHVLIAAYIRSVSQYPALNRFIAGQEVFARFDIVVSLTIKKEMTLDAPDTVIKAKFEPDNTVDDVYRIMSEIIDEYRNSPGGDFDDTAAILNKLPGLLMKFSIGFLRFLDYFGKLPKSLVNLSPFHASMFITSMGSLGVPPVFHHLYDFGNIPVFLAFGAKEHKYELTPDGKVTRGSAIRYTVVMDERTCDGYYYAAALKYFRKLLKNPWVLDEKPEKIVPDID